MNNKLDKEVKLRIAERLLELIKIEQQPMLMYEHEKEVVKEALIEYTKLIEHHEEKNKENGINYYAIENTINEYQSRITGRYATIDEARKDMKNKSDWYVGKPSGNIYHIIEWFDGFNHKVEKRFIERHLGNEIRYSEY